MSYSDLLRDPRWQRRRLEIMARDGWKCRLCGESTRTLNVYHLRYGGAPWDVPDVSLVTTCEDCHKTLHFAQIGPEIMEALIVAGADMEVLVEFQEALVRTTEGPGARKISKEEWASIIAAFNARVDELFGRAEERCPTA